MPPTTWREATKRHGRRLLATACTLVLVAVPTAHASLGDLDPAFDFDGIATPNVGAAAGARFDAVARHPDGGAVAAGWAFNGSVDEPLVMRLDPSGAPENTFGSTGPGLTRIVSTTITTRLHAVALDGSGRVLAAGRRAPSTTAPFAPFAMRLGAGGNVDAFANDLANLVGEAHAVIPLPGGKILVGGWRTAGATPVDRFFVARLNEGGTLDGTFGSGGVADVDFGVAARAEAMALAPDGRIVLAGSAGSPSRPAVARLNANGTPDGTFAGDGSAIFDAANPDGAATGILRAVQVDGIGRITAAGASGRFALVLRYLGGGSPDPGFGAGGATYGSVSEAAVLNGLALDGARSLVTGRSGPLRGPFQLLLGSLDGGGIPEPALGGAPPGWRSFPGAAEAFGAALGPDGTVYIAGGPDQPFVSRHLPNAAPTAALAGPAQVLAGEAAPFDAAGSSDPEGEQLRYEFDLDGDGGFEFDGGANPLALRSFPAPGGYTVGVRVTDPRGASASATRAIAVVAPPGPPPPQPVLGAQGVAKPVSGIVLYKLPGTKAFLPMTGLTAIPNGTVIDVRNGRLLITVLHDASGRLDGAEFYAGRFVFRQGKGAKPRTTLKLSGGSFADCVSTVAERASRGTSGLAWQAKPESVMALASSVIDGTGARSRRRVRRLWGDGRGRFRTRGRYGAATVRGTKWVTVDRCDGTKVRVVRGKVSVQDLVRPNRRSKLVKAGQQAFVPSKRGG